jgi:multiple sugar transport system substrate-binding protein
MARYLPAYREANIVDGKVIALPYFADAQFLYYRKDLLEKHGVQPPTSWEELIEGARKVLAAEGNPNLTRLPDRRRADRGHGVHLPRPAVGGGRQPHPGRALDVNTPAHRRR